MKNTRLLLILSASVSILATSAYALAQTEGAAWPEQGIARRFIARMESRLNITSEQRAQAKAILKAEEPTIVALAAQAKEEREAMIAIPAYNEAAVREVAETYAATNTNIVVERAKIRLELRGILTEEQLQQLEALKTKLDGHFSERLDTLIDQL